MTATVAPPVQSAPKTPGASKTKKPKPVIDPTRASSLYTTRAVQADPAADRITEAQVRQFHEQGWLAIEGVYSAEEVETAKVALADFIHGRITPTDGKTHVQEEPAATMADGSLAPETPEARELRVRKVFDFTHHDQRLRDLTMQARLRGMLDQLIAPESRLIHDMALLKPPMVGSEKPWHQDTAS